MKNERSEQEKAEYFLNEVERLRPTNRELVVGRRFFEIWENSCEPRPFFIDGSAMPLGGRGTPPPKKGKYIAWLAWSHESGAPVLFAEIGKTRHRWLLRIQKGKIRFGKPETVSLERARDGRGERIEIIYDVIDYILSHKPGVNVLKLKKKEFTQALDNLPLNHDAKLLKRMARLPVSRIRELVARAASDMAIDDLSMQLSLPIGDSYALESGGRESGADDPGPRVLEIYPRTPWEITREIELLLTVARCNHEAEKQFILPLRDCEIIRTDEAGNTFVKLSDVMDKPLREGDRLTIHEPGERESLGVFTTGMFDYDTIYGELSLDDPGDVKRFKTLYLQPRKAPHRRMMRAAENLYNLVKGQPERIKGALASILGLRKTEFVDDPGAEPDAEMDFSQKEAWRASVNPDNRVVAVQGPPGTGKTWVLVQVAKQLCARGERILVTAPSNTAVDNVCRSVSALPVLRFGNPDKVHPEVRRTCWYGEMDNFDAFLDKQDETGGGSIFAATHVRALIDDVITGDLHANGLFDVIIFDEAGMSRLDEFLLCAQLGRRVIVFGDQRQLPPFPLSTEVLERLGEEYECISGAERDIIHLSALEWLARNRGFPVIMLQRSYRCQNPRLLRFSSTLFYHARVKTSETAEYFRLPYHARKEKYPPSTLRFYRTSMLPGALREEKMVFDGSRIGLENPCEAYICKQILLDALRVYPPDQVTIISPYKRQVNLIRALLRGDDALERLPEDISPGEWKAFLKSRIATVDSFQGGESDLVIISYVRCNDGQGIGFVDNPNRINVAHTRCRREIVIIGDLDCLKKQARTDIFERMERAFARDGGIIDVEESFFDESFDVNNPLGLEDPTAPAGEIKK